MIYTNKKLILLSILAVLLLNSCFSVNINKIINPKENIPNFKNLKIDNVSFDKDELMTINIEDKAIGFYDRFENKSYEVKGAKVYSKDKKLIYSLVPEKSTNILLHIKNNKDERGLITVLSSISGLTSVKIDFKVDFFSKPYSLETAAEVSISNVKQQYLIKYNNNYVMAITSSISSNNENTEMAIVDKDFLLNHPEDVSFWAVTVLLFNDVNRNESKKSKNRR